VKWNGLRNLMIEEGLKDDLNINGDKTGTTPGKAV